MEALRRLFTEALERLAAPAAEQESFLRGFGTWPSNDELALDLDDVAGAAALELCQTAQSELKALDVLLEQMSGPNPLWDGPALYTAPEWAEVRELARRALAAMDAEPARIPS